MKKSTIIFAITVLVLIFGIAGIFVLRKAKPISEVAIPTEENLSGNQKTGESVTEEARGARYVEYSKSVFAENTDNRRVLYFYANWCPLCRPADADFKANEDKIPEDAVVIRVNYNDTETDQEEKDLAKKYGITYQHTFVQIDGNDTETAKWNGGQTEELLENIK